MKKNKQQSQKKYEDIELPKPTGMGIYISGFAFLIGFAIVWHIFWLVAVGLAGVIACIIIISFDENREYVLPAAKVAQIETSKNRG